MNMNPINAEDLKSLLNEGTVQFAFKKLNGDLRTAVGTTCLSSIPVDSHPSGDREPAKGVVTYFDLEKNNWRSVSETKEIFLAD